MYRKLLSVLFALATVFAAAAVAVSPARADDDDDDDGGGATPAMAFGDFVTNFLAPNQHVVFTATDGGLPGNAGDGGAVDYTNPGVIQYSANLVCVSIVGATARFGYVIPPGNFLSGTNIIWQVTDGDLLPGQPPDTAGFTVTPDATLCDVVGAPETPIASGEITVVPAGVGGGDDDDEDHEDDEDDEDDD